jgi:hypothetical protein
LASHFMNQFYTQGSYVLEELHLTAPKFALAGHGPLSRAAAGAGRYE